MKPQENFSPRPFTLDDLPEILRIEREVHAAPWDDAHFTSELTKPYSHSILLSDDETDSRIAAYIVFWILLEECQILNVAVDLSFRGLGFGKKLLKTAVNQAIKAQCSKVTLDVRKSNAAAIGLYQSLGFSITHIRKSFYSNGEDAYQMDLPLAEDAPRFE